MKEKLLNDAPLSAIEKYFSVQSGNFYNYPVELQKEILETESKVLKKMATATELERLVEANPDIPEFRVLLFQMYDNQGRSAKMIETALQTVKAHPDYLAGRCYLGLYYILQDEFEKVFQLFKGFIELNELFPERTGFLSTEEDDYLFMGITYFASVRNIPQAARRLEALKTRNPDYPLLDIAERIVDHARMNRNLKLFEEWDPKRRKVEYADRSLPQLITAPTFELPDIEILYDRGLTLTPEEITNLLTLPRDMFIRDLEKMIIDARQRYRYFFYEDDEQEFPDPVSVRFLIHAVLFLTECRAEESLPLIMGLLEEDEPFFFDWFEEYFEEIMVPAIYQLGQRQLDALKNFMFKHGLALYSRDVVVQAISLIALHQPERRSEVIRWFDEVFHYFIDHREEDGIIDTDLIGAMVTYCTDIKAIELQQTIRTMFGHDLVSIDFCVPYEDVEADLSGTINENDLEPLLTIFEQYEYFLSEMVDEDNDEPDIPDDPFPIGSYEKPSRASYYGPQKPVIAEKTPGRNDPCPCGSGKKYKKCCLKL